MGKFLESIMGKSAYTKQDDYMDLDLSTFEDTNGDEPASMYVKVAQINDIKDTPRVKDEVYNGNLVIVDITRLKLDKIMCERVLKDLREVAHDVNGDIIGLGEQQYVIITPMSVRVSREKIGGL